MSNCNESTKMSKKDLFFQRLLDTIPNPIFYKDANGIYLGCNKAFEEYIGLPAQEVVGKSVYDVAPKELADIYFKMDMELFEGPGTQIYEASVIDAHGKRKEVLFNKAVFFHQDGTVGGLIGVIVDITERKQAETALNEYQSKIERQLLYAQTLNSISETIAYRDDQSSILESMVQLAGQMLGVDRSLIYYVNLRQNMIFGLCEWDNNSLPGIVSTLRDWELDMFKNTVDFAVKTRTWIESQVGQPNELLVMDGVASLLHEALGVKSLLYYPFSFSDQGFYLIIFHQISHCREWREEEIEFLCSLTKQVEIALQKTQFLKERQRCQIFSEQQLAAMKASMDGIAVINQDGTYTYANEAFANIFGYQNAEELVGIKWKEFYDKKERKKFRQEIITQFWETGQWRGEVVGRRKDGSPVEQEISLTIIEGNGLVSVVRDITERKLAERQIWEEKERAQVTLQSIGDAVITTDNKERVEYLNPVAEDLTGWNSHEVMGMNLSDVFTFINEETGQIKGNPVVRCLQEGRVIKCTNNTVLVHRDGYGFAVESSVAPIKSRDG